MTRLMDTFELPTENFVSKVYFAGTGTGRGIVFEFLYHSKTVVSVFVDEPKQISPSPPTGSPAFGAKEQAA